MSARQALDLVLGKLCGAVQALPLSLLWACAFHLLYSAAKITDKFGERRTINVVGMEDGGGMVKVNVSKVRICTAKTCTYPCTSFWDTWAKRGAPAYFNSVSCLQEEEKKKKKSVTVQSPHYKRVTSFSHLVLCTVGEIRGAYPTYPQDFPVYQDTANNICNLSSFRY